jgi:hypothetical protein
MQWSLPWTACAAWKVCVFPQATDRLRGSESQTALMSEIRMFYHA